METNTDQTLAIRNDGTDHLLVSVSAKWEAGEHVSGTVRLRKPDGDPTLQSIENGAWERLLLIVQALRQTAT